jgi:hypothetical protein
MLPWVERPSLEIDLALPLKRRFVNIPADAFDLGRELLAAVMRVMPARARWLAYWVRLRTANRFHGEAVSLARAGNHDWRDITLANIAYDLILATFGCSTVALPTPSGPVIARNMDFWPEDLLARASYLIRVVRDGQPVFASAGWPGTIGIVTGLSARGFAVVLNAVIGPDKFRRTGYPVLLHLRRVVEDARDFDHALQMLTRQTLAASALFTLVGSRNPHRVVVERTPTRHALRWPRDDEPLIVTNDYRLLYRPETHAGAEIYETTCQRYDALCRFFGGHRADREVDDSALLYILSDPDVIQQITAQHIILRPRQGTVRLLVPRRFMYTSPTEERVGVN